MIDGKSVFDQPVNNKEITYDNIRKVTIDRGDDYTTGCLLDYHYFKDHYQIIIVDLSKQQALNADPKPMQQINFHGNLKANETILFILEEVKETVFYFSQPDVKVW